MAQRHRPIVHGLQSRRIVGAGQSVVAADGQDIVRFTPCGSARNTGTLTGALAACGGFGIAGQIGTAGMILSDGELQDGDMVTITQASGSLIAGRSQFRVVGIFGFLCSNGLLDGACVRALDLGNRPGAVAGDGLPFAAS